MRLLCLSAISRRIVKWDAVESGPCDITLAPPNPRLHLTPLVGAVAGWTVGTLQGTGSLFQVAFWSLAPGFQKIKYVCGAGEPQPLGSNMEKT